MSNQDRLFDTPQLTLGGFTFDAAVAAVFPDMVNRSIPGYPSILHALGQLTQRFMQPYSRAYDLGCSLGAASLAIYHNLSLPGCQIIAIDNSAAMVAACQQQVDALRAQHTIQVLQADLSEITLESASLVVLNFTLQFIAPPAASDLAADLSRATAGRTAAALREAGVYRSCQPFAIGGATS